MTDIQLWEDPERPGLVPPLVRTAVRARTLEELTQVIEILRPYATGMMGEISPKMVELYLAAMRQRVLLVGAHLHPVVREPVVEPEVIESTAVDGRILGAKVLLQLEQLESEMGEAS